jgi:hypothetical protein
MKKRSRTDGAHRSAAAVSSPSPRSAAPEISAPAWERRIEAFLDRRAVWIAVALMAIATLRIADTYRWLSYTVDEPAHVACGMEWLDKGTYTLEPQHPPLARVMTALLPRLFGAHSTNLKEMWPEGLAILSRGGQNPDFMTTLARIGILPFFWLLGWVTFIWTGRVSGRAAAVLAVFFLSMTPAILAHAGLATTDMGLTATLVLALYSAWRWLEDPTLRKALAFGATMGLAVITKFSTLAFLPAAALAALLGWLYFEKPAPRTAVSLALRRLPQLGLAILIAMIVIWTAYRFSFGRIPYDTTALVAGEKPTISFPVPAPEFFAGIEQVRKHNELGHLTYLLGKVNTVGWPEFYAVALGVKTPLPLLALALLGLGLFAAKPAREKRGWILLSIALGILVFSSFFSQIRIGTRHVLPVFAIFAIAGAHGLVWLLRRFDTLVSRAIVGLAVLALAASSFAAHPDYLGYFNLIASSKPQEYLVDSDLDWGQDVKRLGARLRDFGAREVYFNQFAPGDIEKLYGFPKIRPLDVNGPHQGWNAVSLTNLEYGLFPEARYAYEPGFQFWPDKMQPTERIGSGILLFYLPPQAPR